MNQECLSAGLAGAASLLRDFDPFEILLVSFLLAALAAPAVLALYRRRVGKLMAAQSKAAAEAPTEPAGTDLAGLGRASPWAAVSPQSLVGACQAGSRGLRQARLVAVGVFAVLTGALAILSGDVFVGLFESAYGGQLGPTIFALVVVACLCAPLALRDVTSSRARWLWILAAAVLTACLIVEILLDPSATAAERAADFGGAAIVLGALYASIGGRRLRNVVPLLTVLVFLAFGAFVAFGVILALVGECESHLLLTAALGLAVLGPWLLLRLTFKGLERLTEAYEEQRFSDEQFQLGSWMVIITLLLAVGLAPGDEPTVLTWWTPAVVAAGYVAYRVYRWRLRRLAPWEPARRLLLLRVFSDDKRGRRLLDEVARSWRFVGPVYLVAGPDLAKDYLEPHELLLFVRRKLAQMFVTDRADLERRIENADEGPDPDTRYRINEFFCFDNVWRQAVEELVEISHAVLLDVRGFDASRRGTAFEVALLARMGVLEKTVFLLDEKTDRQDLEQVLSEVPGSVIPPERQLDVEDRVESSEVLSRLFA